MPKAKPVCMYCTGPVMYGALHCSPECEALCDDGSWTADKELVAKGFEQDAGTPNLYAKDGVSISLESVRDLGMVKALRLHQLSVDAKG